MKTSFAILILCIFSAPFASAQAEKISLSHDVYDDWKDIFNPRISADGRYAIWEVNPQAGDGMLYITDLKSGYTDSISRGARAQFSPNSDYFAFYITPPVNVIRQARLASTPGDLIPGDSIGIYSFGRKSNTRPGRAGSFSVSGRGSDWMVYMIRQRPEGTRLFIFNPLTREEFRVENVQEYSFSPNGRLVVMALDSAVKIFNTDTRTAETIFTSPGRISSVTTCPQGARAAFLFAPVDLRAGSDIAGAGGSINISNESGAIQKLRIRANRPAPEVTLWYWQEGDEKATGVVNSSTPGMPDGWGASPHRRLRFNETGSLLYFGTAVRPRQKSVDSLLDEEKVSVDLWHYLDPLIQPQQLVQLRREIERTWLAVYHTAENKMIQLATPEIPDVTPNLKASPEKAMGVSTLPYMIRNSFESGEWADVYLIDLHTGKSRLAVEKYRGSTYVDTLGDARLSPEGKYLVWFSQSDSNWHSMPTAGTTVPVAISAPISVPLYHEFYDQPGAPGTYGIGGWTEDDRYVLLYDRFDIWKADPEGIEDPVNLTGSYGRANNIQFRYLNPDPMQEAPGRRERVILSAFDFDNMQSGFYSVRMHRPGNLSRLVMDDARYQNVVKARDSDVLLWQRGNFREYPDLYTSNMNFRRQQRLSFVNDQQEKYRWGSAKLVNWVSFNSDTLQGILYMPDDMEPDKKYPMIVYFYERLSHTLHNHYVPAPSNSVLNIPFYVSNNYVVFVPDITYTIGSPGHSAYNAVVSGTRAMVEQYGFIDSGNIGIQGQSWAGYQITWLITRTDIFKAAMVGAPVSNMISGYGGIRWSTGISRIFQYEEAQSRIGGTLWEKPEVYIENSPVMMADRITTPLLIMHNEKDGAVPWQQGIELFMALRRLEKPVWMLNYNDEGHILARRPNRMDFSVRMHQFFDHYLKGSPPPLWMTRGIPASMKGIINGFEPGMVPGQEN